MQRPGAFLLAAWAVAGLGCSERPAADGDPAVARGRAVYRNVCVACHNGDPAQDGTVGPAVAGSSRELLEAMILHGKPPPGYTPRRSTDAMPAYPQLADEIDALTAYLASVTP